MKNFKIPGVGGETGVSYQNGWNEFFAKYAEEFYDISTQAGFDPRYIVSIGALESGWGTSNLAQTRKNTFGYGAYDGSVAENAWTFDSQSGGIGQVCKTLKEYEKPGTWQYNRIKAAGYDPSTIEGKAYLYANGATWGDGHVKQYADSISRISKQVFGKNANVSESSSTGNNNENDDENDEDLSGGYSLEDVPPGATIYETSKGLMWCPEEGESAYSEETYSGDANERIIQACKDVTEEFLNRPGTFYSLDVDNVLISGDIARCYKEAKRYMLRNLLINGTLESRSFKGRTDQQV